MEKETVSSHGYKVGSFYRTRGGWKAKIVHIGLCGGKTHHENGKWVACENIIAVHFRPEAAAACERSPIPEVVFYHTMDGKAVNNGYDAVFGVEPLRPNDLLEEI